MTCRVCGYDEEFLRTLGTGPSVPTMAPGLGNICTTCAQAAAAVRDWYLSAFNTEPENYQALLREAVHGQLVSGPRRELKRPPEFDL
jgi:hypothetical protein